MGQDAMISVKLRFVYDDTDRHGNVRIYFWHKGGRKVRIRETPGTQSFFEVYHELLAQCEADTRSTNALKGWP